MHKGVRRNREEEDLDDSLSRSFKIRRRAGREHDVADHRKNTARNPQWVYGNLFECISGNDNCPHGRIPFGGSFYCAWTLKKTSADLEHSPPCLWDTGCT